MPEVVWIEVDCPQCGNVNRRARRQCDRCKGTGKVRKSDPADDTATEDQQ
jgi:phage FluMu protein Com